MKRIYFLLKKLKKYTIKTDIIFEPYNALDLLEILKLRAIPKIRFKPNALDIKYEIMKEAGYVPVRKKTSYKALRNTAASAFDKLWDAMMVGLIKSAKRIAVINHTFVLVGQNISEPIKLAQSCIMPQKVTGKIYNPDFKETERRDSYIDRLKRME